MTRELHNTDYKNTKLFTTGQVAELLHIAPRTVTKLFDSKRLNGFRLPAGDRRITRESLIEFLDKGGIDPKTVLDNQKQLDQPTPKDTAIKLVEIVQETVKLSGRSILPLVMSSLSTCCVVCSEFKTCEFAFELSNKEKTANVDCLKVTTTK